MTDYFRRLAARSLDSMPVVMPRVASRYATPNWTWWPETEAQVDRDARGEQAAAPFADPRQDRDAGVRAASPMRRSASDALSPDALRAASTDAELATAPRPRAAAEGERETLALDQRQFAGASVAPTMPVADAHRSDQATEAHVPAPATTHTGVTRAAPLQVPRRLSRSEPGPTTVAHIPSPVSREQPQRAVSIAAPRIESARAATALLEAGPALPRDTQSAPEIHVSIGRIEVRAIVPPVAKPSRAGPPATRPALSLETYLEKRREGSR